MSINLFKDVAEFTIPDDAIVVECGANTGTSTKFMLKHLNSDAKVFAFEPDPRCIEIFKKNISDDRCVLYEKAVGDFDGTINLKLSNGCPDSRGKGYNHIDASTIKGVEKHQHIKHPWIDYTQSVDVPIITLDSWFKSIEGDHVDFMWIDVEGANEELIKGGMSVLSKTDWIYMECFENDPHYDGELSISEILELLPNYTLVKQYSCDSLFRRTI